MSATKRAFAGGLLIFSILVLILEGAGPGFGMMQPLVYVTTTTATSIAPSSTLTSKVTTQSIYTSILPGAGVSSASTTASSTSEWTSMSTSVSYSTVLSTTNMWTVDYIAQIDTPIVFLMQTIYEWILLFIHKGISPVGGFIEPADRMTILGPYVGLLGIILAAGVAVVLIFRPSARTKRKN